MPASDPRPRGDAHRLFFALWPDDDLRAAMATAVDGIPAFRGVGRRVDPAKYHVTLHFLGGWAEMPADVVAACGEAAAAVQASALHLVVDHAGSFARSRVGWLAPGGNSGLDALWSELGHALRERDVDYRESETYSPHVTVLRNLSRPVEVVPIDPLSWPVDDFVLVHSHGGRYEILERWTLDPAE